MTVVRKYAARFLYAVAKHAEDLAWRIDRPRIEKVLDYSGLR